MLPEDERRLQRERDIYLATRGPDYSQVQGDIARAMGEKQRADQSGRAARSQKRTGYQSMSWYYQAIYGSAATWSQEI